MLNIYRSFLVLIFLSFLSIPLLTVSTAMAEEDKHKEDIKPLRGNLICLLPDKNTGNVTPVIATSPCDKLPQHAHVFVDFRGEVGQVYAVQGTEEAILRLEKTSNRKDIEIKGKIQGNQDAWILIVE